MNIGIIASSNGSTFKELLLCLKENKILDFSFYVVLDRKSTLIEFCKKEEIEYKLIEEPDNKKYSKLCQDFFYNHSVKTIILFFLRLVTKEIYSNFTTINLHPSLLPLYKGFNAIKQAQDDNFKFLGATLHLVDETVDNGPILIQTMLPIKSQFPLEKISFLQKTLLLFILFDYILHNKFDKAIKDETISLNTSPGFYSDFFYKNFKLLEERENIKVYYE